MRKGVICVCRYVLTLYLYLYLFSYFLHRHNQALIERETAPRRTVYQNWPFWVKTPITSRALICSLYKLQGSFIILLGVYCEKFFWWNPVEHLFLWLKGFCISYAYALFDVQHGKSR